MNTSDSKSSKEQIKPASEQSGVEDRSTSRDSELSGGSTSQSNLGSLDDPTDYNPDAFRSAFTKHRTPSTVKSTKDNRPQPPEKTE